LYFLLKLCFYIRKLLILGNHFALFLLWVWAFGGEESLSFIGIIKLSPRILAIESFVCIFIAAFLKKILLSLNNMLLIKIQKK